MSCYLGFEPTTAENGYYFVSYNSDDVDRIQPLVKGLFDAGVPLWYDHALEYGKEWKKQIARKIKNSDAVLLFLTKGVLHKEFSYVREEYEMATDYFEKTVYVVLLDTISKKDVPPETVPWWMEVIKNHLIDLSKVTEPAKQIAEICRAIGYSENRVPTDGFVSAAKKGQTKNKDVGTPTNRKSFGDSFANLQKKKDADEEILPTKPSAPKEDANTLVERGRNYYYGCGVEQNYYEAFACFMKAAEQGYADAQNWVGVCYDRGHGTPQNYELAFTWIHKAAEQGLVGAQNNLGMCYYYGRGTTRNYVEALKWYQKAAEQGDAPAQNNIGMCNYNGHGTSQNFEEAYRWFRMSGEQGNAFGQAWVGFCYEYGQGTTKNITEAIRWYRKAAQQGDEFAKKRLAELGA